jgi:apolipoprotein N-acyltransferase
MQFVVLILAGWAQSLSLAWPFGVEVPVLGILRGQALWWLQILAMAVFARSLLSAVTLKQAAWRSWLFSTAWLCGSVWWLYVSMHTYGGLAPWLAAFAVLLLSACMALFYVMVCLIFHQISTKSVKNESNLTLASVFTACGAIIFASCWMLAEMARGTWLTGFPWGAVGYSHLDGPLAGLASYVGVYGMSFVAAFAAMALTQWLGRVSKTSSKTQYIGFMKIQGLTVLMVLLAAWALGLPSKQSLAVDAALPKALNVTLLQGNIPQNEKFQAGSGVTTALAWYAEQLDKVQTGLVVTPETAIPLLPQSLPPEYWRNVQQSFKLENGQKAALIGIPKGDRITGFSNSVVGFKPTALPLSAPYQYDKDHLVPFGEFIPPFAQWFIDMMKIPLGVFVRGGTQQPPFYWQGQRLGLNICYEDLFGEELAGRFANPAVAPTMLVNLTNIAWFGNTIAIDQHLNIARLRSMELAKPSIRATNTGATVIIDAQGKVTHSIERHTRGVLVGQVWGNTVVTPYAAWVSRFWLWPLWGFGACVLALAAWFKSRERSKSVL